MATQLSVRFGPLVERMIRRDRDTLDEWSGRRGGEVLPVCGYIPMIALMVVLGAKMSDLTWYPWFGIAVAAAWVTAPQAAVAGNSMA